MRISREALENKINFLTEGYWKPGDSKTKTCEFQKYLGIYDPFYEIPSKAEVSKFFKATKQAMRSQNTQNPNIWDCDQYSRYLWVEAAKYVAKSGVSYKWTLGIISARFTSRGDHTCNWVYMDDGNLELIEPQDFSFHDKNKNIVEKSIRLIIV